MENKNLPPFLTQIEIEKLAVEKVQEFVNACHCKNRDDVLLALSVLLAIGMDAGETIKHGKAVIVQ